MNMIKCEDFDVNCCNSDANCTADIDDSEVNIVTSKGNLINNGSLCDVCPYNTKFKNFNHNEFEEYKKNN